AFLKSIDSKTWKAVVKGWEHPVVTDKDGNNTGELKSEGDWSKEEDELALGNSKALNALFNGVDKYMFRLIKKCTVAKDAWEILKTTHEGTSKVKMSRLQLLTTKFENLRMKEDECIHDFHMNVLDFANSFDSLGEKISEEKLVRKILRSLPKKFDMKVTAIEEAQYISSMKVVELVGSLQTFELAVSDRSEKKNKSIALVSNTDDEELQSDMETDESISDAIVLLGRQFNKVVRRMDRRPRSNVKNIPFDISKNVSSQKKPKTDEKTNQGKCVQCHECEGYGHIRTECSTYLKKQKKSLTVSWSDEDEAESELDNESAKHITALTGICMSDTESCDKDFLMKN
ncbi:gag-protease polyprotein, partial [Trifolium medium]|nr:gag-protease polyprotein [Trifolium medium]